MIKNARPNGFACLTGNLGRFAGLCALAIPLAAGCDAALASAPTGPEPLQGVIEHETRALGFEVAGRVTEVTVERGAALPAGTLVARLDDALETPVRELRRAELSTAEAQLPLLKAGTRVEELRAAEADIAALHAQEAIARKNLERNLELHRRGSIAQSAVDDLQASVDTTLERKRALQERLTALRRGPRGEEITAALSRVEAARAAISLQEARIARFALHTAADADVIDVHIKVGEMVAPGSLALTLADLSHPYVDIFAPQDRASRLRVGRAAKVRVDTLAEPLPARVEYVFPRLEFSPRFLFSDAERKNLVLRARVRIDDPAHKLLAGLPAFVTLDEQAP